MLPLGLINEVKVIKLVNLITHFYLRRPFVDGGFTLLGGGDMKGMDDGCCGNDCFLATIRGLPLETGA